MNQTFAFPDSRRGLAMTTPLGSWPMRRYMRHGMLPQLAAFETVMRLGSATRAAEALCIAQPTLSGHLRKLGEALGVRLFEVQGKRLVPTDAAYALLPTAREVFAAFERCEQALDGLRTAGRVSAGVVSLPTRFPGARLDAAAWLDRSSSRAAAPAA
jgi:DNA-binding transcriptional LysR family regulator